MLRKPDVTVAELAALLALLSLLLFPLKGVIGLTGALLIGGGIIGLFAFWPRRHSRG
jgi:hypothetical protein